MLQNKFLFDHIYVTIHSISNHKLARKSDKSNACLLHEAIQINIISI